MSGNFVPRAFSSCSLKRPCPCFRTDLIEFSAVTFHCKVTNTVQPALQIKKLEAPNKVGILLDQKNWWVRLEVKCMGFCADQTINLSVASVAQWYHARLKGCGV